MFRRIRTRPSRRTRLGVEQLEDRQLLSLSATVWSNIGPAPILGGPYTASGRVNVAVPDPGNPNVMYIGTPGGGVWMTSDWNDNPPTWTPLTDDQPSLQIPQHGLTLFPAGGGQPALLYAATNGPNGGILKTTTTGGVTTWGPTQTTSQFPNALFGAVVVSPTDSNTLYVAVSGDDGAGTTTGGVWCSSDGGQTFTNLTPASFGAVFATDLVVDPNDPTVLYTGLVKDTTDPTNQGVYMIQLQSGNTPPTWTQANDGVITAGANVGGFIRLAVGSDTSTATPQTVVYATIFDPSNSSTTPSLERFRAAGSVTSWIKLNLPPSDSDYRFNHVVLAVDPSNPNLIYANGDEPHFIMGTFAGGSVTWTSLIPEYPNSGTEDVADATFDDSGHVILEGDRGIGLAPTSPPASGTFQPKQGNLSTALIYKLAVNPADPTVAFAVAQDQGKVFKYTNSPQWNQAGTGSEIGTVLIDPTNPNTVYNLASIENGFLTRSDGAGAPGTWTSVSSGIDQNDFPPTAVFNESFYTALALDPSNSAHLVLGSFRVYETTTGGVPPSGGGNAWTIISPSLTGASNEQISAIAIAPPPASGEIIYAATADGHLFVSPLHSDASTAWTPFDTGLPLISGNHVVDLAVDPNDAGHLFAVTSGANSHPKRVWEKTSTTNWTAISSNLPASYNVFTIAPDWRFTTPVLYVGTERGVYRSTNDGTSWSRFGPSLPATQVQDLDFLPQTQGGVLAAATYGRGAYEISVPAEPTLSIGGPPTANEGDTLTYTVTIRNDTPANASNVVFTDALPAGLQFISANFGLVSSTFANGTLTVPLGVLASGDSVSGTITVLATTVGVQTSQGSVTSTLPVTNPASVPATATTTVISPPITGGGGVLQGLEGSPLSNVTVATFAHANDLKPANAFVASIAWGDGSMSPGAVIQTGAMYSVLGSHTYTDEGNYAVMVTVTGDGMSATFPSTATILAVLPDGTRGTADQRFVVEAFGDLFGQPPSRSQLAKYSKKLGARHANFVTTLLATAAFEDRFRAHEVSVLFAALVGSPPTTRQIKQGVASLAAGKSLAQVARKWPGVSASTVDPLLVQALVEQFLDRPTTPGDFGLYGPLVARGGKLDHLAVLLVGSAAYFAKTST
jgi:uncharacterized repeat protein (TIGR01451 family)